MKPIRFILLFMLFAAATSALAQAPQRFNYQAVARDASGNAISEKTLGVRISIIDGSPGGSTLYTETFSAATNKQGLFSIQVGGGTVTTGTFSSIVWQTGAKFLKVEIDPAGGSAYAILGTSQLLSVPFAFAADKLSGPLSIKDMSDVADTAPSADQVLKWDGVQWAPATVTSNAGLITSSAFTGDGTAATPLKLAQQSATNGQVLQWNGTDWKPATVSGGVGDNWGTQSAVTNSTLTGNGTAGSPLGIAAQGATNGQVMKFNGTTWAPANDFKVTTSSQFGGDGTTGNPLKLAQNGAAAGQIMTWNGTNWVPDFANGGIEFPYVGAASNSGSAFFISNTGGHAVEGATTSTNADVYGLKGTVVPTGAGTGSAGVYGRTLANTTNGYGVLGIHEGSGLGVQGTAKTGNGIGVSGDALGPAGIGVRGSGATGVYGVTTIPTGNAIYGNGSSGGYAGYFDGKTLMQSNGSPSPVLNLREVVTTGKPKLRFDNNVANRFWDITAFSNGGGAADLFQVSHWNLGNVFTIDGNGAVGMGTTPSAGTRLEIFGHLKISGGIVANGTLGNPGQVLTSNGGSSATWGSPTASLHANTYLFDQVGDLNNISTPVTSLTTLPNLATSSMQFTLSGAAKVVMNFSHSQLVSNGTGDVDLQIEIGFRNTATGAIVNRAIIKDVILNNKSTSISYTHHCSFGGAGTFQAYIYIGTGNSGKFNAIGSGSSTGQVSLQVIHQ